MRQGPTPDGEGPIDVTGLQVVFFNAAFTISWTIALMLVLKRAELF